MSQVACGLQLPLFMSLKWIWLLLLLAVTMESAGARARWIDPGRDNWTPPCGQQSRNHVSVSQPADELTCLACNVIYESEDQPAKGMIDVSRAVLKRTTEPGYASNACGVIYTQISTRHGADCPFSWVCRPRPLRSKTSWQAALKAAADALKVGAGTYDSYYNPHIITPYWARNCTVADRVQDHVFMQCPPLGGKAASVSYAGMPRRNQYHRRYAYHRRRHRHVIAQRRYYPKPVTEAAQ